MKGVVSPFTAAGAKQVSADARTAYATVVFTSDSHEAAAQKLAKAAATSQLDVQVGGPAFTKISPGGISEVIGVLAALLILILVFRSAWAAVLPIITGVAGVGVSSLAVILLSHVITLPSVAPELGALIGLGVGIDYALFIVNRHRKALRQGADLPCAIATAMNTSGRAVLFAGGTVIVALLGLLILNVGFVTGLGIGAAVTVFLTVMAAVTLLPALLARWDDVSCAGPSAPRPGRWHRPASARGRIPGLPARGSGPGGRGWSNAGLSSPELLALVALAVLAAPALTLRLGAADASSTPAGTSARSYYDTMADAFGKGFDAPLLLVAQTPDAQARTAWTALARELPAVQGRRLRRHAASGRRQQPVHDPGRPHHGLPGPGDQRSRPHAALRRRPAGRGRNRSARVRRRDHRHQHRLSPTH